MSESDSRAMNSALETINAAATAIAMAENRVHQASARDNKRRWGGCLSVYWCFGAPKNRKRIGHVVPEITLPGATTSRPENPTQPPSIVLPFIAPPSSPASFLQSEPPSATQSPVGALSISANMYSPGGPSSIFAIGPYAHETQLVSPPVFSTFTTEPSTAPFTPPPESGVHLTTPSSPEVPFARLLDPNPCQRFPVIFHTEFQSYHLQPGSPVGQLISPSSGISGSGPPSPFPDLLEFRIGNNPPKLLNLDNKLSNFDWGSRLGSGSLTPQETAKPLGRVSFELKTEGEVSNNNNKTAMVTLLSEAVSTSLRERDSTTTNRENNNAFEEVDEKANYGYATRVCEEDRHQKHRSITLGSSKEFNFDNADAGDSHRPGIGSDWWANEKVAGNEASREWSFFPIVQPSVS